MIAGLRPSSQNVIFKQNLSGQARGGKKRAKSQIRWFSKRQKKYVSLIINLDHRHVNFLLESVIYSLLLQNMKNEEMSTIVVMNLVSVSKRYIHQTYSWGLLCLR